MSLIWKHPHNSGGYCNQLWHLVGYYLVAKKNNLEFFIDDSCWNLSHTDGWRDYFSSLNRIKDTNIIPEPIYIANNDVGDKYVHLQLNDFTINEYRNALNEIMQLNFCLSQQLKDILKKFNLKVGEFDAIMIRRGVKISTESIYIETEKYVNELLNKGTKTIFVQTDDYNAYTEVCNIIKNKNTDIKVYTICPKHKQGIIAYKCEINILHHNTIIPKYNNYLNNLLSNCTKTLEEYTKEEMQIHMEESIVGMEICLLSRFLALDLQSNITRYLKVRHNNPTNVICIDREFPDFNTRVWPMHPWGLNDLNYIEREVK